MIPVEKQVSAFPSGSVWVAGIDEAGRGPVLGNPFRG